MTQNSRKFSAQFSAKEDSGARPPSFFEADMQFLDRNAFFTENTVAEIDFAGSHISHHQCLGGMCSILYIHPLVSLMKS
jgi:hypothetical protein